MYQKSSSSSPKNKQELIETEVNPRWNRNTSNIDGRDQGSGKEEVKEIAEEAKKFHDFTKARPPSSSFKRIRVSLGPFGPSNRTEMCHRRTTTDLFVETRGHRGSLQREKLASQSLHGKRDSNNLL